MVELIIRILVNAAALWVAVQVLPDNLLSFAFGNDWWKLLAVALVFALVNSYIKPIVKALSFPISMMTLGLVAFVINAALLLLVAFLLAASSSSASRSATSRRTSPPTPLVGALVGAVIISVVSTLASIALSPRKLL